MAHCIWQLSRQTKGCVRSALSKELGALQVEVIGNHYPNVGRGHPVYTNLASHLHRRQTPLSRSFFVAKHSLASNRSELQQGSLVLMCAACLSHANICKLCDVPLGLRKESEGLNVCARERACVRERESARASEGERERERARHEKHGRRTSLVELNHNEPHQRRLSGFVFFGDFVLCRCR